MWHCVAGQVFPHVSKTLQSFKTYRNTHSHSTASLNTFNHQQYGSNTSTKLLLHHIQPHQNKLNTKSTTSNCLYVFETILSDSRFGWQGSSPTTHKVLTKINISNRGLKTLGCECHMWMISGIYGLPTKYWCECIPTMQRTWTSAIYELQENLWLS
jgi:hypothetical protein